MMLLWLALLMPSDACYARFDDVWCDAHAEALAEAKPQLGDLVTDTAGGYGPGDPIDTGWGHAVPAPPEALDAVSRAGTALGEQPTTPGEERTLLDIAACESDLSLTAASPLSTASGPWQFLAATWARVAGATGYADRHAWGDHAANALWLARHGGWQHWACWP